MSQKEIIILKSENKIVKRNITKRKILNISKYLILIIFIIIILFPIPIML